MKRYLLFALMLGAGWNVLCASVKIGKLYYYLDSSTKTAEVTYPSSGKYSGEITIPSTVTYQSNTYSVTSIGRSAFSGCTGLTSVTIGNSVTSIGRSAFSGCSGLTSVTIPYSVTSIGYDAFYGCTGLTSITIPNSVTSIGADAFNGCTGLTSITIPESVTSIGDGAFYNVPNIVYNGTATGSPWGARSVNGYVDGYLVYADATKTTLLACYTTATGAITIPNSVTSIGDNAFYGCTGLTSITIPNSVTSIGNKAFGSCTSLTSVTIGNSVTSIGEWAFSGCTGLTSVVWNAKKCSGWSYSSNAPFYDARNSITSFTFGNEVESIPAYLCYDMSKLTSVTIPNSVTSIGGSAFDGCTGLTSIVVESGNTVYDSRENCNAIIETATNTLIQGWKTTVIPNSVTSIGHSAFYYCTSLTSITIPNSVTSIGNYAFNGCTGLTSVTIPNSVTSIGSSAFSGCTGLASVTIGNSVTSIRDRAFSGCTGLTSVVWNAKKCIVWSDSSNAPFYDARNSITSFTFGDEVESIPEYLCLNMSKLTSVTISNSVKSIGKSAFSGCSNLTSVSLPNSVTIIGDDAFYNCTGLTSPIYNANLFAAMPKTYSGAYAIPDGILQICGGAFSSCSQLTSISIPNSVKSIGKDAFDDCSGLTSITIPNSVTSIGNGTFSGCTGLTSVTIGNSVTSIGYGAFYRCTGLTSVTIPNSVTSIGNGAFSGCTGLTSVVWNAKKCSGWSYSSNAPFYDARNSITSFTFGDEVESIPEYLCSKMSKLTSITIPNSVKSIGESAFSGCSSVTSIIVESGNMVYDSREQCNAIIKTATNALIQGCQNTIIPNSVTSIGKSAFYECTGPTSVTIPNSVTSIGIWAFKGCTGLTSVTIPNSVTSIGNEAFYKCSGLTSITIPYSVTSIGYRVFSGCSGLTSVTIPNSVTSIGYGAFKGCTGLTSITIGSNVISIEDDGFEGCIGLTSISVLAKIPPKLESFEAFNNVSTIIPVYIPYGTLEAYSTDTYWARFLNFIEKPLYKLTVTTQDKTNGFVEIYKDVTFTDSTAIFEAVANKHYHFVQWSDGNTDNPRTITLVSDTTLCAEFAIDRHTLTLNADHGTVVGAGTYDYGTYATISATPNEHYRFVQWSDGNAYSPRTILIYKDITLTAEFVINPDCSINAVCNEEQGNVSGGGVYDYNTEITLLATPNEHYHFVQWSDGNTDNPRTVLVEGDATYTAVFAPNQYTISATAENGRVEGTGEYDYGTTTTLTATADAHYHFTQWSDGNTDNPRTVLVEGDATYTAEFAENQYTIMVTCDAQQGSVFGGGTYGYGSQVTLGAIPNSGYEFKQWSNGFTYNPYRFTVVSDITLEAEFIPATAIDNISADTDTTPQKIILNGQVYILRNNKTYTLTGVEVE